MANGNGDGEKSGIGIEEGSGPTPNFGYFYNQFYYVLFFFTNGFILIFMRIITIWTFFTNFIN